MSSTADENATLTLRQGSAPFEAFIAEQSLEHPGDLVHGARHLANLLAYAPADPAGLALAERYRAAAGEDPAAFLLPVEEQRYAATEALRAWLWARQGDVAAAVDLLLQVADVVDTDYLNAWALDWLEPEGGLECLGGQLQMRLFSRLIGRTPEADAASARQLRATRRWAALTQRACPPEDFREQWPMLHLGLLRRAGLYEQARALAGPLDAVRDGYLANALGLLLRQQGDAEQAERAFSLAQSLQPDDLAASLEAGDTWLEQGDWPRAAAWYEQVLERQAEHPWALPSKHYCQWRISDDDAWLQHLIEAARAGNTRAHQLWFKGCATPPEPGDASANVLRQMRDAFAGNPPTPSSSGPVSLRVSSLEAPSNGLAFALEFAAHGLPHKVRIETEHIPSPDPRQPVRPVPYPLWRYHGEQPEPAQPAPAADIVASVAELAARPYDPRRDWAAASHLAATLDADQARQVFACMVWPPALPAGTSALAWLPRVQLSACQVLAQYGDGWAGSLRRDLLLSALLGPTDWTTEAAIQALAWIAAQEPLHALDIHEHFEALEKHKPDTGHCGWLACLYEHWQTLPLLHDKERERLGEKLAELSR